MSDLPCRPNPRRPSRGSYDGDGLAMTPIRRSRRQAGKASGVAWSKESSTQVVFSPGAHATSYVTGSAQEPPKPAPQEPSHDPPPKLTHPTPQQLMQSLDPCPTRAEEATAAAQQIGLSWRPICGCALAASFTWAVEDLLYIPMLTAMGAPPKLCSWIFLSNAVLGLAITPHLSSWSDRIGRRRPFILGGAACAVLSLLSLMAVPRAQGVASGDMEMGLVFVLAGGVEFGVDLMLSTGRSLLCDNTEHNADEMSRANAAYGFCINLGRLLGMAIASRSDDGSLFDDSLFLAAAAVVGVAGVTATVLVLDVKRTPPPGASSTDQEQGAGRMSMIGWLMLAQCTIAWISILTTGMYFSSLVASRHSTPALASFAMAAQSLVAILSSPFLPAINSMCGAVVVNNGALLGYSLALVVLGYLTNSAVSMVATMAVTGITCAVIDCNPYVIVEQFTRGKDRGSTIAMLDNTMNAAQVFCAVGLGYVVHVVGDITIVFRVIGLGSGVAMLLTIILIQHQEKSLRLGKHLYD